MGGDQWEHIDRIFTQALDVPEEARASFLETACGGHPETRKAVEQLLQAVEIEDDFLEKSPMEGPIVEAVLEDLDDDSAVGRVLGPYEVERQIGRGGMGAVYLANRIEGGFDQKVALKLIKRGMDTNAVVRRFQRERSVMASLQHPNIARLLDGGASDDGQPFFAMEYIQGKPVDAYCDEYVLTIEERLELFVTVCNAVQYAHRNLIVHRDLKPSNVLVESPSSSGDSPSVKLLDFGIAGMLSPNDPSAENILTNTGLQMMTPAFAAPEQLRNQRATTATDIYALGGMLYVLLTGHLPFETSGKATHEIEKLILESEPTRPSVRVHAEPDTNRGNVADLRKSSISTLRRQLSGDLDTICLRALQKEPGRRYASVEQFATDVQRYLDGEPIRARPDTFHYRTKKFIQRNKVGVALGSIACLILVAGVGGIIWQASVASRERDLQAEEAERANTTLKFVRSIFRHVSPEETEGEPITAERILAAGIEELGAVTEPRARGQMLAALADLSYTLGLYEASDSLWGESLKVREEVLGPADLVVTESLVGLAIALQQTKPDSAISLLERALPIREHTFGQDDPRTIEVLNELGWTQYYSGEDSTAIAYYERALSQMESPNWDVHPLKGEGLYGLATVYSAIGRPADAEHLLRDALAIRTHALGENDPNTLYTAFNLATALRRQGKLEEARTTYLDVLEQSEQVLGPHHNQVANALFAIGLVAYDLGNYEEAVSYYRRAREVYARSLGEGDLFTAFPLANWGHALLAQGSLVEAEEKLNEALSIYEQQADPDYPRAIKASIWMAECMRRQGRTGDAQQLLQSIYQSIEHNDAQLENREAALEEMTALAEVTGRTTDADSYRRELAVLRSRLQSNSNPG